MPCLLLLLSGILLSSYVQALAPALHGIKSNLDGVEYVYQLPSSSNKVKGVVFLAHGCGHASTDWWPAGEHCSTCIGLPVERSIVTESLSRGYAVLAVSSSNREHKCWSPPDIIHVSSVIDFFYKNYLSSQKNQPPLFLLGASSGGSFVGHLSAATALHVPVKAICVQISATHEVSHIPVVYVLMERDAHSIMVVQESTNSNNKKILTCAPKPINANYFFEQGGVSTKEMSQAIQQALLSGGFLFTDTLLLKANPRNSNWRSVIEPVVASSTEPVSLVADASPISELLNVAWSAHEITAEHLSEVFDWFSKHGG